MCFLRTKSQKCSRNRLDGHSWHGPEPFVCLHIIRDFVEDRAHNPAVVIDVDSCDRHRLPHRIGVSAYSSQGAGSLTTAATKTDRITTKISCAESGRYQRLLVGGNTRLSQWHYFSKDEGLIDFFLESWKVSFAYVEADLTLCRQMSFRDSFYFVFTAQTDHRSQDLVEHRKNSWELYGYDFMVDDQHKPWLIEINSSPACDYSTKVFSRADTTHEPRSFGPMWYQD